MILKSKSLIEAEKEKKKEIRVVLIYPSTCQNILARKIKCASNLGQEKGVLKLVIIVLVSQPNVIKLIKV